MLAGCFSHMLLHLSTHVAFGVTAFVPYCCDRLLPTGRAAVLRKLQVESSETSS